jgi:hypothetical protein
VTVTREDYLTRQEIIDICSERDGYYCYMCKAEFSEARGMELTLDHFHPLSKGGTWDIENMRLAHRRCNQDKADRVWLDNGELEPRVQRLGYQQRKQNKEQILLKFCELCMDGRLLMPEEYCPECFRGAVAWPQTMKRKPSECSHSGYDWCWLEACGLIIRTPAFVDVLDGEYTNDD